MSACCQIAETACETATPTVSVGDVIEPGADTIENGYNSDDAGNPGWVPITGRFGGSPHLVSAAASADGDEAPGVQSGDKVVLTFDSPTNAYTVTTANIGSTLLLLGGHTWGTLSSAVWSTDVMDSDTLTVTLSGTGDPTIEVWDAIAIPYGTIYDSGGTYPAASDAWVTGSFGHEVEMVYAMVEDASGGGAGIQNGDQVTVTFDRSTNYYDITTENVDTALSLSSSHTWSTIDSAYWSDGGRRLTVTFGTGSPTLSAGDSITIGSGTIMDWDEELTATGSPPAITGSDGTVTPKLAYAEAEDESEGGLGIQDGDRVVLVFDRATNAYSVTAANVDTVLSLSGGHTWGSVSATWSTADYASDTLTVVLDTSGATPTVSVWDTITIGAGTIRDSGGAVDAIGYPPAIEGSFGDDERAPTITITNPDDEDVLSATSVTVAGSVTDEVGVAAASVNGEPVDPDGFSVSVDLDEDGAHTIVVEAFNVTGNTAAEYLTVYRDTECPEVVGYDLPSVLRPGRIDVTVEFYDPIAGLDTTVDPTITLWAEGGTVLTATKEGYSAEGVWTGYFVLPPEEVLTGAMTLKISGAADLLGNTMVSPTLAVIADTTPPTIGGVTVASYVSPAYVKGEKSADGIWIEWRYNQQKNPAGWNLDDSWHDVEKVNGVWGKKTWWTEIPLDVCGKSAGLTEEDRTVWVDFRCEDFAGNATTTTAAIEWKLTVVGQGDHLVQQAEKMIIAGPADTCTIGGQQVQNVYVQVYSAHDDEIIVYEPYDAADPDEANVVYTFEDEGPDQVFQAGFACQDVKTGEPIPDTHTTTSIHVIKKLKVRWLYTWPDSDYPPDVASWEEEGTPLKKNAWVIGRHVAAFALAKYPIDATEDMEYDVKGGDQIAPHYWVVPLSIYGRKDGETEIVFGIKRNPDEKHDGAAFKQSDEAAVDLTADCNRDR